MTDDFDALLGAALAPPERAEDLAFARRVQQRIRFDEIERTFRRRAIRQLFVQLFALAGLGAGLALASRSAAVATVAESAPQLLLAGLLALLLGWCWIVVGEGNGRFSAT